VPPGQQHPQQHMYGYGEPPPGLAPAPPHLQHLPPQLHLQQPMAVPHDPRRPQGPPPGLPPGPHMPLGSSLPPGLAGAAPPPGPMDPRQRGAAGAHPLPQVVVAGSVPLGGMPPPAGGEGMGGGVHGLTQPVAAVPGAAEASRSLPAKLVLVLRVWLLRVGRYAPKVTHPPHNQAVFLGASCMWPTLLLCTLPKEWLQVSCSVLHDRCVPPTAAVPPGPPFPGGPPPPAGEEGAHLSKVVGGLDISRLMTILGTVQQQPPPANGGQQQQPASGSVPQGLMASLQPAAAQVKVEPKMEPKQEPYSPTAS
jgi:hypothetical protein